MDERNDTSDRESFDALDGDLLDAGLARAWGAAAKLPRLDGLFGRGDGTFDIDDVLDLGGRRSAPNFSDVDILEAARTIEKTGRYLVEREIGRGGMGVVLAATDRRIGRIVALKLMHGLPVDDPRRSRRFVEEAQIAGQLEHPGICPVYDVGLLEGRRPFIAMKFVEGETFADLLKRRTRPGEHIERSLDVFLRTAEALAYAHARGVIHRDLKPSNILLGSFGETLVTDWGLAKVLDEPSAADRKIAADSASSTMKTIRDKKDGMASTVGAVMGTPAYMAPEQLRADPDDVDPRTDVFLLGGILCEILTGRAPFPDMRLDELRRQPFDELLAGAHRRLEQSGFDAALIAVARRCLSFEKVDRPPGAGIVAEEIAAYRASLAGRAQKAEVEREAALAVAAAERRQSRKISALSALAVFLLIGIAVVWVLFTLRDGSRRDTARRLAEQHRSAAEEFAASAEYESALVEAKRAADLLRAGDPGGSGIASIDSLAARLEQMLAAARRRENLRAAENRLIAALAELRLSRFEEAELNDVDAAYARAFAEYEKGAPDRAAFVRAAEKRDEIVQGYFDWWILRRYAYAPTEEDWWRPPLSALEATDENPPRIAIRKELAEGNVDGALAIADKSMKEIGSPVLSGIAIAVNRTKDRAKMVEFLDAAIAGYPRDYFLRFERGMALAGAQPPRFEEALLDFAAADAVLDDGGLAALNTGVCLSKLGRHAESLTAFLRVRGRKRLEARALQGVAAARFATGDYDRGEKDLERLKSIAAEKQKSAVLELEIDVLTKREKFDAAITALDTLIADKPDDLRARFKRADLYLRRGEAKKAAADLEAIVRAAPDDWRARYRLGTRYLIDGRVEEAHGHLARAVLLSPSSAAAHINLGQCRVRLGRPEEALAHLLLGKDLGAPPGVPIDQYIAACRKAIDERKDD